MDFKECLIQNEMICPNYEDGSIIDVVRTIYEYCGYKKDDWKINKNIKKYIKNKKHIVLILVDGMGSNLVNLISEDMVLKKNKVQDILTVAPSTTGCVLTSVVTAEYPSTHGMIGWYNYNREKNIDYCALLFKDRKNKESLEKLGITNKDIYKTESALNKLNRYTTMILPEVIADTNFSKFECEKNRVSYDDVKDAFEKLKNIINNSKMKETFTYLYLSDIDYLEHRKGINHEETLTKLREINDEIEKLKYLNNKDLEIVIIADHGQIDIVEQEIIMDFDKYNKYFYALPGIDLGTATYYVKENMEEEFLKEFENDFEGKMFIFRTEDVLKYNLFGKEAVSDYMRSNLGEYISFCKKGSYFLNTVSDKEKYIGKIKGCHSGFSKEEMFVPLIVC